MQGYSQGRKKRGKGSKLCFQHPAPFGGAPPKAEEKRFAYREDRLS